MPFFVEEYDWSDLSHEEKLAIRLAPGRSTH